MIAIISDIHGNYPALEAVMKEIERYNCKKIISLGDIAGYYCMINECITLLQKKNVINILGNHDYYLINNINCPRSTSANICLDYQKKIITEENLMWLKQSIREFKEDKIWGVHGGWEDLLDEYIEEFDLVKKEDSGYKIFLSGHSHIQKIQQYKEMTYCNPGSVGQPRDNNSKAAFALIDDSGYVKPMRVSYDIDKICNEMKKTGLKQYLYNCLYYGEKIGGIHTKYE